MANACCCAQTCHFTPRECRRAHYASRGQVCPVAELARVSFSRCCPKSGDFGYMERSVHPGRVRYNWNGMRLSGRRVSSPRIGLRETPRAQLSHKILPLEHMGLEFRRFSGKIMSFHAHKPTRAFRMREVLHAKVRSAIGSNAAKKVRKAG